MEKGYLGNNAGPGHKSISSRRFLVCGGMTKYAFFRSADQLTGQSLFISAARLRRN